MHLILFTALQEQTFAYKSNKTIKQFIKHNFELCNCDPRVDTTCQYCIFSHVLTTTPIKP